MKLHVEYRVDQFHYTDDGDLVVDTATLASVNLCHDGCPDEFNESFVRISENVITDEEFMRGDLRENPDKAARPADQHGRPDPGVRVH